MRVVIKIERTVIVDQQNIVVLTIEKRAKRKQQNDQIGIHGIAQMRQDVMSFVLQVKLYMMVNVNQMYVPQKHVLILVTLILLVIIVIV